MPWSKGQSGNPRGRPPKGRSLAELLAAAGERKNRDGIAMQQAAAARLWELIDRGEVVIAGETVALSAQEWLRAVSFVFAHVDGPARGPLATSPSDAGELLDQVLDSLRDEEREDQAAVAAGLGALVLQVLAVGNREALNIVGLLQQGLESPEPDVAQLVGTRRYLLSLPEPIHGAAETFFQLPAVASLLKREVARA